VLHGDPVERSVLDREPPEHLVGGLNQVRGRVCGAGQLPRPARRHHDRDPARRPGDHGRHTGRLNDQITPGKLTMNGTGVLVAPNRCRSSVAPQQAIRLSRTSMSSSSPTASSTPQATDSSQANAPARTSATAEPIRDLGYTAFGQAEPTGELVITRYITRLATLSDPAMTVRLRWLRPASVVARRSQRVGRGLSCPGSRSARARPGTPASGQRTRCDPGVLDHGRVIRG